MADQNSPAIEIVARLRDEVSAGLEKLRQNIQAFAQAATPASNNLSENAAEIARAAEDAAKRIEASAKIVQNTVRSAGASAPGSSLGASPLSTTASTEAAQTLDAKAAIDAYLESLKLQSAARTLSNQEHSEALALFAAEANALRAGSTLTEQQRQAIVAEVRAREQLLAFRAQEAAELLRSRQINADAIVRERTARDAEMRGLREAILARDAERQAQGRAKDSLELYLSELREERSLLKLDANEREIAIALRRAEALAVRAGISDHERYLNLIRQELQANQQARAQRGLPSVGSLLPNVPGLSNLQVELDSGASAGRGLADALGLSTRAAAGLAAAGAGLAVVGGAIASGTKSALELEKALQVAAVRSREVVEDAQRVRDIAVEVSNRNVTSLGDSGRAISESFLSGARNLSESASLVRAASDAAVLGFGSLEESVRRVDAVNDAFQLNMRDSAQTVREVFVAAQEGEAPAGAFAEALARVGVLARQVGVPLRDTAAVLSVITRAGVDTGEAAAGLSNFLLRLGNPLDGANRRLRALGVESSAAAIEQRGLLAVLRDIQRVVEQQPELANELFGSPRVARAAFTAIEDGGRAATQTIDAMREASTRAGEAIDRGLNQPGERVARTWQIAKNNLLSLGDAALAIADRVAGTSAAAVLPDLEPADVKQARKKIAEAIAADDPEAVRTLAAGLQRQVDAAIARISPDPKKVEELLSKLQPGTRPEDVGIKSRDQILAEARAVLAEARSTGRVGGVDAARQLDALRALAEATTDVVGVLNSEYQKLGRAGIKSFEDIGKAAVVSTGEVQQVAAKLRDEFAQTLGKLDAVRLRIEPQVEPEAVQKARETIQKLGAIPKDGLSATQTQELQDAVAIVQQYSGALTKAQELSRRFALDSVTGIERENVARGQAAEALGEEIEALERQGVVVVGLRRLFRALREEQDTAANAKIGQQRASGEAERLAVLAANVQKSAELARLTGDLARADELDRQALQAKAIAARAAFDVQQRAAVEAVRGSALLLPAVLAVNAAKIRGLEIDEESARLALDASKQRRDDSIRSEVERARTANLQGIQSEIAGIRLAQDEYRNGIVLRVQQGTLDETNARRLIRLNQERSDSENATIEREASRAISEEILRIEAETATTLGAQALAQQGLVKLDQQRIRDAAVLNGATDEQLQKLDELFAKQVFRPKLELDLQRSFGSSNLPEIVLRGRIEFEQSIVDAQVSEEAARASAELEERLRGIDQTSPEFQQAVSAMQERLEAFRDSVERANASLGRGFQLGVQQSVRELGNDTTLGLQLARDSIQAFTSNTADALTTLENGLARGKVSIGSFVASLARDLQQAINRIIAFKIVSSIFGSIGGDGYELPGTLIGRAKGSAKGNVFRGGEIVPFAKGAPFYGGVPIPFAAGAALNRSAIYNSPTLFRMANGQTGLLGEAGPEAIMPLAKGANGKLGVVAQTPRGSSGPVVHVTVSAPLSVSLSAIDSRSGSEFLASHAKDLARLHAETLNEHLSATVVEAVRRAAR